jgi:hypothetical protein
MDSATVPRKRQQQGGNWGILAYKTKVVQELDGDTAPREIADDLVGVEPNQPVHHLTASLLVAERSGISVKFTIQIYYPSG